MLSQTQIPEKVLPPTGVAVTNVCVIVFLFPSSSYSTSQQETMSSACFDITIMCMRIYDMYAVFNPFSISTIHDILLIVQ